MVVLGPIHLWFFCADDTVEVEADSEMVCMEERLRSLGILSGKDDPRLNLALKSTLFDDIDLEANMPEKKVSLLADIY